MSKKTNKFYNEPWTRYAALGVGVYILVIIFSNVYHSIVVRPEFAWLKSIYPDFISLGDIEFNRQFVEWFGVLYGFLLPLILVKAWDQFEALEREFDKELDSVQILHEDLLLLPSNINDFKKRVLKDLSDYVNHVKSEYIDEAATGDLAQKTGNKILIKIRKEYTILFDGVSVTQSYWPLISQLLTQLNTIIDVRGDRISSSKQRLFQNLRGVAVFSSFVWLMPFYFLGYELGIFGDVLVISVTALIIYILHVIEDLDEPFYKKWRLENKAWKELEKKIQESISDL